MRLKLHHLLFLLLGVDFFAKNRISSIYLVSVDKKKKIELLKRNLSNIIIATWSLKLCWTKRLCLIHPSSSVQFSSVGSVQAGRKEGGIRLFAPQVECAPESSPKVDELDACMFSLCHFANICGSFKTSCDEKKKESQRFAWSKLRRPNVFKWMICVSSAFGLW